MTDENKESRENLGNPGQNLIMSLSIKNLKNHASLGVVKRKSSKLLNGLCSDFKNLSKNNQMIDKRKICPELPPSGITQKYPI